MSNLIRKTKDALIRIGKDLGIDTEGTKAEIVERIEAKKEIARAKGILINTSGISEMSKIAREKAEKDARSLEKRLISGKKLPAKKGFTVRERNS